MVEPIGLPGPLHPNSIYSLGSHTAHNLEVTRTVTEILQSVPAHLEIAKEAPMLQLREVGEETPTGNRMVSFLMGTEIRER